MKSRSRRGILCLLLLTGLVIAQEQVGTPGLPAPIGSEVPAEVAPQASEEAESTPYQLQKQDYKENWKQAGSGEGRLGDRLRSHIVRLNEDDTLLGRLTVIEPATGKPEPVQSVKIRFVRKGRVQAEVSPDANGSFSVKGLERGVYSMIAAGEDGFLAWSVNVQPKLADMAKLPPGLQRAMLAQEVKDELDVQAAAVPPANFIPLKELLTQYLPSEDSTLYLAGNDLPPDMDAPPRDADPGTSLKHHQVRLTDDGRLLGRIRRLQPDSGRDLRIRQLNVFLLQGDSITAQEDVAPNGTFAFEDMRPGVYSMVAAGRDGFLAFSIDVLGARKEPVDLDVTQTANQVVPAAFRVNADEGLQIDVALCSPADFNQQNLAALTDGFTNEPGAPIADAGFAPDFGGGGFPPMSGGAGPGMGGGGGGGFGGGGSGGGLGGVLLGGALGAGIGVILDDDDGQRKQASPSGTSPQ